MDLASLSDKYGAFYVPAFAVRAARSDLMRDEFVAVSQVEADLVLGGSGRFSFTVVDAYDIEFRGFKSGRGKNVLEMLAFGTEIELRFGYGDVKGLQPLVKGVVTEITTNFPETGSPELAISGYDSAFPMTNGKSSRTWKDARDSDAVQEIASFHNLKASIGRTEEQHKQIEQNEESDFEFVKKLADRNHFEVFVDSDGTLHFQKPDDRKDGILTLQYGAGLLSFKPEANLAGQIARVEVYGWNPKTGERITGEARAGQESGLEPQRKSAGQLFSSLTSNAKKEPVLRMRTPVFTQAEANSRAKAALNERAKQFLTGEAETIGLPEIRPDTNVTLENLGKPFSKTYYVQQATHKIDAGGYRTRFKVKETTL